MTGYEFMAQNPVLTVILAIIAGITATEMTKYMFGAIHGVNYDKTTQQQEKKSDEEMLMEVE